MTPRKSLALFGGVLSIIVFVAIIARSGDHGSSPSKETQSQVAPVASSIRPHWQRVLDGSAGVQRAEFIPNRGAGEISMQRVNYETARYGGGFGFALDKRLYDYWGAERTSQAVDLSLTTLQAIHGSCRFKTDINIYWDRDQKLQLGQQDVIDGTTFLLPLDGREQIMVVLFGENPMFNTLIHELSHANISDLKLPHIIDEGMATLTHVIFDQMWARQGGTFQEAINEIAKGQPRSEWGYLMMSSKVHQPGLEPSSDRVFPYQTPALYQYGMASNTLLRFVLAASMKPKSYKNFFGEFFSWVERNPNSSLQDCGQALRKIAQGFPGERWEDLTLFAKPTEGLFAFLGNMGSKSEKADAPIKIEAGLVILYRNSHSELPPFVVVIQTSSRSARQAAIPQGGFVGPLSAVIKPGDTWVRVWKEGEKDRAVTIRLPKR